MRLWPCLAAFAIIGHAAIARADAGSDADALIDQGVALREHGQDDLALQDFQKAYVLAPSSRARAQIGLAEQALGIWRSAEDDVTAALADNSDPWIGKNGEALQGALAKIREHLGTLEVRCDAPDAEVFIDGASRGKLGGASSIRVESGTREVQVRAPGKYASSRSVVVPAAGVARETIALEPLPTSSGAPSDPHHEASLYGDNPTTYEPPSTTQRNVGWAFLGTSAALVVTGFLGIGARSVEINSYNNDPSCPGLAGLGQPPLCQSKIDTAQTWTTISIVGFVGAGVLATGGAILLLTAPRARAPGTSQGTSQGTSPETSPRASQSTGPKTSFEIACAPTLGIVCAGRF